MKVARSRSKTRNLVQIDCDIINPRRVPFPLESVSAFLDSHLPAFGTIRVSLDFYFRPLLAILSPDDDFPFLEFSSTSAGLGAAVTVLRQLGRTLRRSHLTEEHLSSLRTIANRVFS